MKKRILSVILLVIFIFNLNMVGVFAESAGHDAYNFDFGNYDSKTNVVVYKENVGWYGTFGYQRYICFKNVRFDETAYFVEFSAATGSFSEVDICVDTQSNTYASFAFDGKSGWSVAETQKILLDRPIAKGTHDIYIVGVSSYLDPAGLKFYPKVERIDDFSPEKMYSDLDDFELRHRVIVLTELGIFEDYEEGIFDATVPMTNIEALNAVWGLFEGSEDRAGVAADMDEYVFNSMKNKGLIGGLYKDFKPNEYISEFEIRQYGENTVFKEC